jgi:hypothetical protein
MTNRTKMAAITGIPTPVTATPNQYNTVYADDVPPDGSINDAASHAHRRRADPAGATIPLILAATVAIDQIRG